jgi:hypothetical protein
VERRPYGRMRPLLQTSSVESQSDFTHHDPLDTVIRRVVVGSKCIVYSMKVCVQLAGYRHHVGRWSLPVEYGPYIGCRARDDGMAYNDPSL